jgi:TolB-like protein/Tfp pilus assembly protein PilF
VGGIVAEERVKRRLAAILAADVVGYSRLIEADEEGTRARLRSLHSELLEPQINADGGRIVKTTGDGILVEFGSAVDAVRNAFAIQSALMRYNAELPDKRQLVFRIGINLGDVIIEEDDIHGEGVNVAARLEGICEPGAVYVSGTVRDHVEGKIGAALDDLGERTLKNISRPIRVYRVSAKSGAAAVLPDEIGGTPSLPDRPSIAVLPFENMSGDAEQDYFADGIAEDIITALSRFRWFFVIARNSSFTYKGRNVDIRQIGRELGVRYVLEGSVRRGGSRLRITAQLVETATGNHLWAERYDGALEDVFDLQDQIAEGVAGAVEPSVRQAEIERARLKHPESLDAYELYLRALPHAWAYSREGSSNALNLLRDALQIEPSYAAAHGLAAWCYAVLNRDGAHNPAERDEAIQHAHAVLASDTDDSIALGYAAFIISLFEGDHDAAVHAMRKALALTPNSATVLAISAIVHAFASRFDTAMDHANRSHRLSPFDPTSYHGYGAIAWAHLFSGRYAEAADAAQNAVRQRPGFVPGFAALAASYVSLNDMPKAREAVQRMLATSPALHVSDLMSLPRFSKEERAFLGDALRKAGLP